MKLDRHHIILYAALFLASLLGLGAWAERQKDLARAQAEISAQKQLAKTFQDQAREIGERERQAAVQTAEQLSAMREALARVQTPQQIAQWIRQQPGLEALRFEVAKGQSGEANNSPGGGVAPPSASGGVAESPDSPPDAIARMSQADLPALRDFIENCQQYAVARAAAEEGITTRDERLRLAGEQLSAVERERDAALRAAKGGGFLMRVKRNAKWLAVGAGIGYAVAHR